MYERVVRMTTDGERHEPDRARRKKLRTAAPLPWSMLATAVFFGNALTSHSWFRYVSWVAFALGLYLIYQSIKEMRRR
jgi:hypothetical protein